MPLETTTRTLVVGATGKLGVASVAHLARLSSPSHVRALVRPAASRNASRGEANLDRLRALGVEIVEGELTDAAALDAATKGIDVVVSAVSGGRDTYIDGQTNVLRAAQANGVKKFIPSTYAFDMWSVPASEHTGLKDRVEFGRILAESGMPHAHILIGGFLDKDVWGFLGFFNQATHTFSYYGDADVTVQSTTYDDSANFTAHVALDPEITGKAGFVGEAITVPQIAAAYGDALGIGSTATAVRAGSIDDLSALISQRVAANPANWYSYIPLMYQRAIFGRKGRVENLLNARYPDIVPTTVREYVAANAAAFKGAAATH